LDHFQGLLSARNVFPLKLTAEHGSERPRNPERCEKEEKDGSEKNLPGRVHVAHSAA
jgi:hypothetical protein